MTGEGEPDGTEESIREQIDALASRFVHEVLGREGVVTGWVLCISRLNPLDDGDTAYGWDHTIGPQTDLVRAIGLLDVVGIDLSEHVRRACGED